ncbi:hypothetical protein IFM89_029574 [Coptis chinensis]|uniref:Cytidyltransferase-like domain-containing protein n=1 Tax=Coptis chinensis TaxID=261450 RepID=A0A835LC39_9MAGN|nr:hypothetical protein IFM89_029574 [Coptis chinensis]
MFQSEVFGFMIGDVHGESGNGIMVGVVDDDDRNEIQLDEESPDESNGRCDAVVHEKSDNGGLKKLELVEKVAIIAKSSNFSKTFSAEVTSPEEDESGGQILSEDALNRNGSCTAGVHGETENGGSRLELEVKPAILANSSDADNFGSDDIVSSEGIESIEKISESDQSCELRQTAAHMDTFVKEEIQTPETENVTNVISSYANFRNRKCNQLRQTEGSSNVVEKESESESDDEFEKEEAEERLNSDPDGSDDEGAEHSESDVKGSESGEDSEEETRNHNSGLKGSSAKTTSSAKDKSKKVTTEKKETLVKSPKKVPMTNNSKANDSIGESPVVFSRRKKSEETTNKKSFAPSKCSSKENDSMEKSGKKSAKGKDKVKEACAPTDEELRKVIYKILSRSDLKTGNGTALKDIPKGAMDIPLPLDRLSFPSPSSDATTLDAVNRDQTCVVLLATASFNPPTYMHLRLFELARDALSLDGCYVLGGYMSPVNDAYMKRGLVSAEHRLQLCELACRSSSFVMVDSWEAKQSNYQRTLTVLARISSSVCESKSIPRESLRVMLVCGSDLLESFSIPGIWIREQVRAICRDYGVVCIRREGKDIERVISADDILNEYKVRGIFGYTAHCCFVLAITSKLSNLTGAKSDKFNKSKGMHFEKAVN